MMFLVQVDRSVSLLVSEYVVLTLFVTVCFIVELRTELSEIPQRQTLLKVC